MEALYQEKINTLINLINEQNNIDKIYLYAKDLRENEILIKQRKNARIKQCYNDPKAFIECSKTMDDDYENIKHKKKNLNRF